MRVISIVFDLNSGSLVAFLLAAQRAGGWLMLNDRYVYSQLIDSLPKYEFDRCVARYHGNRRIRLFSCFDQFLCSACSTDLSCEPARHRDLPPRPSPEALPRRLSLCHRSEYARRCQRTPRLAHLRGLRSSLDRPYAAAVLSRWLRAPNSSKPPPLDSTTIDLCLTLFPWGAFPSPQVRGSSCTRSSTCAREYPLFRADYPRQGPRRHRPGHLADRARAPST